MGRRHSINAGAHGTHAILGLDGTYLCCLPIFLRAFLCPRGQTANSIGFLERSQNMTKRVRKDTFMHLDHKEIHERIERIVSGRHVRYYLREDEEVKLDGGFKLRCCWRVYSRDTDEAVDQLWSAAAYRSFYLWWIYLHDGDDFQRLVADVERVNRNGKDKYHHAHRCGNDWCVNPEHIRILSRTENEVDKHFHYFLNSPYRHGFMHLLCRPMIDRGIW